MNPRKKFKPRNSNSNSENEINPVPQGQCVSSDRPQKSSPTKHSPSKQRLNNCTKNSPSKNVNSQRGSPHKCSPVKRQLQYNQALLQSRNIQSENKVSEGKSRKSPHKNPPPPPADAQQPEDFASPKLSFSSPNAADVPLPPTHWFSGCSAQHRSMYANSNITNQLKTLLNVV